MLSNFFKITIRGLLKNKTFSIINIAGLAIGMAAAVLILLWIQNEMSYDRFYSRQDRIYDVWNRYAQNGKVGTWNNTPKILAKTVQQDYPEIERTARVNWGYPVLFSVGDKRIKETGNIVDSGFLQIFDFPLLKGNPATALNDVSSIVITEKLSKILFGTSDVLGKTLQLDNSENFTVTGVLKDLPNNTSFDFEYLVSWAYLRKMGGDDEFWGNNSTTTYILLKENVSAEAFNKKIQYLRKKYDKGDPSIETFIYPLSRKHLYARFENGKEAGGRIEIVSLFGIIAAFILLVACINFMNLSTARSEKRAKEVGIRKVVGAQRKSLISQFLGESIVIAFFAGLVALIIVRYTLPSFNELVGKQLVLDPRNPDFWIAGIACILVTGILAGSYPALYLSSFRPVSVLKGTFRKVKALVTPRKVLVVLQFTFAIVLIIATIIVRQQMKNAQQRQMGYAKSNLIYHFMEGDVEKNYKLIKNELLQSGIAASVTKSSAPVTEGWSNSWGFEWQGKRPDDKTVIDRVCADDAVVKTLGLQIVKGRDFDLRTYPTDSTAIILNESAVQHMGFKEPIGQIIKDNDRDWHVVGVIRDFIMHSPYHPTVPLAIEGAAGWFNVIHIKFNDKNSTAQNLSKTEAIFKKYNPEYPFNFQFVDDAYGRKFSDEKRTGTLASLFALLTILISCLGLFGLASYMAEARVKEIGVRKVLGATVFNITRLLSRDFLRLVLVAFAVAAPLAYWAMHSWLQDFPYRVSIQWWVFAIAGSLSAIIALLTVSFQAIKAAIANPVKSLRSE